MSATRATPRVDEARLVATARSFVDISSPTGSELAMAECMRETLEGVGMSVGWQEVEDGRPERRRAARGVGWRSEPDV